MTKQPTSSKPTSIIIGVIAIIAIIGGIGVYTLSQNNSNISNNISSSQSSKKSEAEVMIKDDKMTKEGEVMVKKENEVMTKDDKMTNSGEVMVKKDNEVMIKDDKMTKEGEVMVKEDQVTKLGSYTNYSSDLLSKAETGSVVLFFNASWCPTCQSLVKDINSNLDKIPSDLTILSVDYDKETDLKKKYGVTTQHTLVKVDKNGNQIKKVTGTPNLDKLIGFAN